MESLVSSSLSSAALAGQLRVQEAVKSISISPSALVTPRATSPAPPSLPTLRHTIAPSPLSTSHPIGSSPLPCAWLPSSLTLLHHFERGRRAAAKEQSIPALLGFVQRSHPASSLYAPLPCLAMFKQERPPMHLEERSQQRLLHPFRLCCSSRHSTPPALSSSSPLSPSLLPLLCPPLSEMVASQRDLYDGGVPLHWRDYCSHLVIPLNQCRRETLSVPWSCSHERHAYEQCQYKESAGEPRTTSRCSPLPVHERLTVLRSPVLCSQLPVAPGGAEPGSRSGGRRPPAAAEGGEEGAEGQVTRPLHPPPLAPPLHLRYTALVISWR